MDVMSIKLMYRQCLEEFGQSNAKGHSRGTVHSAYNATSCKYHCTRYYVKLITAVFTTNDNTTNSWLPAPRYVANTHSTGETKHTPGSGLDLLFPFNRSTMMYNTRQHYLIYNILCITYVQNIAFYSTVFKSYWKQ